MLFLVRRRALPISLNLSDIPEPPTPVKYRPQTSSTRFIAITSSCLLHGLVLLGLWPLAYSDKDSEPPKSHYHVEYLHLQEKSEIYFVSPKSDRPSAEAPPTSEASPSVLNRVEQEPVAARQPSVVHEIPADLKLEPPPLPSSLPLAQMPRLPPLGRVPLPSMQAFRQETLIAHEARLDLRLDQPMPLPPVDSWKQMTPALSLDTPVEPKVDVNAKPAVSEQAVGAAIVPRALQVEAEEPPIPDVERSDSLSDGGLRLPETLLSQSLILPGIDHFDSAVETKPSDGPGDRRAAAFVVPTLDKALHGFADFLARMFVRIDLPRTSRPPVSVLGESVAEQFPETAGRMSSRVVSTIYLRVGLKRNWTLEYCLPLGSAADRARDGTSVLDPPWAYTMFRPKDPKALLDEAEADLILVHGILNTTGRLEQLTLVLPSGWLSSQAFFRALEQWEFRPATWNGKPVAVEVMLVIPRQPD
jgi:hypothetical protein